jgi:hypothetical protein
MRFDTRLRSLIAILAIAMFTAGCDEPTKAIQQNPPCTDCYASPDELIQGLAKAYRERDINRYTNVFTATADEVPFYFFLNAPVYGIDNWELVEELRIHRRMFTPEAPLVGETPVPPDLWLASITITLTRTAASWAERTDLYKTPTNPNGIDSEKWKAGEAEYHADILFETQGDTDYRVDGRHNFIVIQDRAKAAGNARKYLIYRWEDLSGFLPSIQKAMTNGEPRGWGTVKAMYK